MTVYRQRNVVGRSYRQKPAITIPWAGRINRRCSARYDALPGIRGRSEYRSMQLPRSYLKLVLTEKKNQDAYLLATVLGHSSTRLETIPRALAIYDKLRRPFSSEVALRAKRNGQMSAGQAGDIPLTKLGEAMAKDWEWAWLSDLDGSLRDAMKMLDSTIP